MNEPIRCPKCGRDAITLFGERWMNGKASHASCAGCRWSGSIVVPKPTEEKKP